MRTVEWVWFRIRNEVSLIRLGENEDWFNSGLGLELGETGQDKASATTLHSPERRRISQLNQEMKERRRCCMADQGGEVLNKA